jgi:zinc protease
MRPLHGLVLLGALAGFAAAAPGYAFAQEPGGIFPFEYRRLDLDNGLRAYLIHAGAPGQIAYLSVVRTGARDEVEPGRTGYAHFFEHMMFRGTKKYPNYDGITEKLGAFRNANTSNDRTAFYMVASSEYLEQIMDLESDRFMNLDYSEEGFRTEAGAILGEYQQGAYSAYSILDRTIRETAFTKHTYRHSTIGLEEDVRGMPEGYEYSRSFFHRFYRPENVVLVIVGDVDFDKTEALVHQYYDAWAPGYQAPAIPVEPEQTAKRTASVTYPGRTLPMVSYNWKAPAWSPTDKTAVATEVLGAVAFGPNSDIYRKLVIQERRLQNLGAGFGLDRDPTLVSLNAMVADPADIPAVKQELEGAVAKARDELVDEKLLADTKSAMKYGFLMRLETAQNVAFSLIAPIVDTGTIEAVDDYYATLESLTTEDIRDAARAVLVDRGLTLVTLQQAERGS